MNGKLLELAVDLVASIEMYGMWKAGYGPSPHMTTACKNLKKYVRSMFNAIPVLLILLLPAICHAELKYNPFTGLWEDAPQGSTLHYDAISNNNEFSTRQERTNVRMPQMEREDQRRYEDDHRYITENDRWSYEKKDSGMKFNTFKGEWEWEK